MNEEIEVVASQDETQNINAQNSLSQSGDVQDSINSIGQILGGMPLGKSLVPNHIQQSQSTNNQNSGSGAQNSNVQVKSYRFYLKLMFKKIQMLYKNQFNSFSFYISFSQSYIF